MNYTMNQGSNTISLPAYFNKIDKNKEDTDIITINENKYCMPESFYIDSELLTEYCWHCQYCNKKHIYIYCSFEQLVDLTLFYECNNCKKKLPFRQMRIHKNKNKY